MEEEDEGGHPEQDQVQEAIAEETVQPQFQPVQPEVSQRQFMMAAERHPEAGSDCLLGLSRGCAAAAMLLWNLVFIGYILYDVQTVKDCIRHVPIFAWMSTLVTFIILSIRPHHAPYGKSWKGVVIPLLFFLFIVIVTLTLNWKAWAQQWCWLPKEVRDIGVDLTETVRYILNLFFLAIAYSGGSAFLWRQKHQNETCTGYRLDWAVRAATPLSELRLEHKFQGQEAWQLAQEPVKLTEVETGGTYVGSVAVSQDVTARVFKVPSRGVTFQEVKILLPKEATGEHKNLIPPTDSPTYTGYTTVTGNIEKIRLEGNHEHVWSKELMNKDNWSKEESRLGNPRIKRNVKLGKIWLRPVIGVIAHHWAVQVGDGGMWYEVDHKGKQWTMTELPALKIKRTEAAERKGLMDCCAHSEATCFAVLCCSEAEAGCCGGELVGKTEMTDEEIEVFVVRWQAGKNYHITGNNCIKFGYDFIAKLTDGKFSLSPSSMVATSPDQSDNSPIARTRIRAPGPCWTALYRHGAGDNRLTWGPFGVRARLGPEFKVQVVAGPGLGVFLNGSCSRVEVTFGLPWLGLQLHTDINLNTGVGARNGNIELHILGFGFKIGADGLEINTPWVGAYNLALILVCLLFGVVIWTAEGTLTFHYFDNFFKCLLFEFLNGYNPEILSDCPIASE